MNWIPLLGYAASATVLATFCMSTMIPLRVVALASNLLFMSYGYFDALYPVFILHAILFPVNALRLVQFYRLVRDMREVRGQDLPINGLLPYMSRRKLPAGETLVRKRRTGRSTLLSGRRRAFGCRVQQNTQSRGDGWRDRGLRFEPTSNRYSAVPHRMHPVGAVGEQGEATVFSRSFVRIRCDATYYLSSGGEQRTLGAERKLLITQHSRT